MSNNVITGNKGEWSEIYTLLKLLGDGKLYAADENVNKIDEIYFPIIKIIREESKTSKYEYSVGPNIQVFENDILLNEIDSSIFKDEANYLYQKINDGGNRSFSIERTESFMYEIGCSKLAAPSIKKTDIDLKLHDIQTGHEPIYGFSIKSEIGNPPTLINASKATNFVFEVTGISDSHIDEINCINSTSKIIDRMERILKYASEIKFYKVENDKFNNNLMLIDSRLPELVAHSLLLHYLYNVGSCNSIVEKLEEMNVMDYPAEGFYRYKFKKFLCSAALGMTPAREWDGIDEANGGYIIVKSSGEVLAYHIYNRAFFENYLLKNTKFERGSTTRHDFAYLYKEKNKVYMKLNLQVRFSR